MLRNYFKTAYRNLIRTKLFSFINILGLSIGLTASLLILRYVNFENSYDRFHPNYERIYRLRYDRTSETGEVVRFASCCPPAGLRIRKSIPEVEKVARIFHYVATVSNQENKFLEEKMFFAEPELFEIFQFKFITGNPLEGIREPNRAFISQSTAIKYFGDQNPIGKTLSVDKKIDYQITGIFENIPENSHCKFDIVLSYANLISPAMYGPDVEESWGDSGWYTYILFKPGTDIAAFNKKLAKIVKTECEEMFKQYKLIMELPLQPLTDIHLSSNYMVELEPNGDKDTVNFLRIIAIFIMVIAWVNYINLSTARSFKRAREVGLRKVVGASRSQLMVQFFIETIIINLVAIILSLGLIELLIPNFSQLTETPLSTYFTFDMKFWITLLFLFITGVIFSGFYPVMVMSSFKPITVIRGKLGNATRGFNLRKTLVVFQFLMAIGLITFTIAIFMQISFMKKQQLGISIDKKIAVRAPRIRDEAFSSKINTFKQELFKNPNIQKFCMATEVPGRQIMWDAGGIHLEGTDDNKNYQIVGIDYDYINMFDVQLIAGRNFSKESPSDLSASLILNETAVKWIGFADPQSAIGGKIDYWGDIYTVVGVVKDFHQQSLKQAFEPHIFRLMPEGRGARGFFTIEINTQNRQNALATIQKQYEEFFPGNPFVFFFLNEYYNQQYKSDERFGAIFSIFSFLAIFITLLGILGLTSFMVVQRTKEISIRKILGSGVSQIVLLYTREITALILISFIISVPLCYYGLTLWLQSFAQAMELNVWIFILPLLLAMVITGITIGSLVIKAAFTNPVENLRYE